MLGKAVTDSESDQTLRYSMNLLRNATKCSARLMLPGTASFRRSSGRTGAWPLTRCRRQPI